MWVCGSIAQSRLSIPTRISFRRTTDAMTGVGDDGSALGEGLYWMAEKLTWGYEGVEKDHPEALRLYRQAADLGFSDAYIRIGQLQEHGKGTGRDPKAALKSYEAAATAGN